MALYAGTSGWAYREWKPGFYPAGVPQRRFLEHYSSQLTACEINATFYRVQLDSTLLKWSAATPEGFRFAVKAHRGLTHARGGLVPGKDKPSLHQRFVKSVSLLGKRLGVVLWQFPPHKQRDDGGLETLLDTLPTNYRHALEFRHPSWDAEAVSQRIAAAGATVVVSEIEGDVRSSLPPGPLAYVRLRGNHYSEQARTQWLKLLQHEAMERDVYAFTKHEGLPTGDPYGGVGLAQWLVQRV